MIKFNNSGLYNEQIQYEVLSDLKLITIFKHPFIRIDDVKPMTNESNSELNYKSTCYDIFSHLLCQNSNHIT
jgi:hypothetical protein